MIKNKLYRAWFYFRTGFSIYLSLPITIIGLVTTTYYLIPFIKYIIPDYPFFILLATAIIFPLGIAFGYYHYKRTDLYKTEQTINAETNPYMVNKIPQVNIAFWIAYIKLLKKFNIPTEELEEIVSNSGGIIKMKWEDAQNLYINWTKQSLDKKYLNQIIEIGLKFSDFIGKSLGRCLDMGCGNGIISGKTYEEVGYQYLFPSNEDYIIGLDPLPPIKKPKWVNEFVQDKIEDVHLPSEHFDTVVMATSLEHLENPDKALKNIGLILKPEGNLYIWTTTYLRPHNDPNHPNCYTIYNILTLLITNGFEITQTYREDFSNIADTVFIKAKRRN